MENKTKKNKTAVAAKTKERRISNKKVESLHKYWEAFPGLKERLFLPVEGEKYSLIKPKDICKPIYSNAGIKKMYEQVKAFKFKDSELLSALLNDNPEDSYPEVLKKTIKKEVRLAYSNMPLISVRKIQKVIDLYWPLVEEYHQTVKAGGMAALKKHPLFISAAEIILAGKIEKEENLTGFGVEAVLNSAIEKTKYIPASEEEISFYKMMRDTTTLFEEDMNMTDEEKTTMVNRHIENMTEEDFNKSIDLAFFSEICTCVLTEFRGFIGDLFLKLEA